MPPLSLRRDIVVVGASAGGLSALLELVRGLPGDLRAAVYVVVHTSADNPTVLPQILGRAAALPVALAVDREAIVPGRISIAPPDHHLVLKRNHIRVTRGPKENRFRPAVDPLFRTAGRVHGPRVIGVILSGGLNDGTHGLAQIVEHGGLAIVQDPQEAMVASMPLSALQNVEVHRVLAAAAIGPAIAEFVRAPLASPEFPGTDESDVAETGDSLQHHTPPGTPSMYTCPECGGALWETTDATPILRFRCHVGHGFTAESLLFEQDSHLENALWGALRALEEHAALHRRMAARSEAAGMAPVAQRYRESIEASEQQAATLRELLRHRSPPPSTIPDPVPGSDDPQA